MTELEMTKAILEHYGDLLQIQKAKEEALELRDAIICLELTSDFSNLIEEIADVENMLNSLKLIFNCFDEVDSIRVVKLKRTLERIQECEG